VKELKWWFVLGVLLSVCFLTYSNSLHSPFMADDHQIFLDEKIKNIKFILNSFLFPSQDQGHGESFSASGLYYRPLAYVISMLSYLAFGNAPYGYHVLNLFLFTLMCFTLYLFVELAFKDKLLAFIASILFAVHPVNVFFVNYITSGIHSVRFIAMFLSVILFLKAANGASKNILYPLSLSCFTAALLCHETSIVLPFYILFTSVFFLKDGFGRAVSRTWPFFAMLLFYLFFRVHYAGISGNLSNPLENVNSYGFMLLIAAFSKIIFLYFSKLLFPDSVFFLFNVILMKKFLSIWIGGLLGLFLGWFILFKRDPKGMPFFCFTWIVLGFLPVTMASLSYPHLGLVLEPQWLTFSSAGFFLFIVWAGLRVYRKWNKWALRLLFVGSLTGLILITRYNNWIWADEIRYYDHWGVNHDFSGHMEYSQMGNIYLEREDYARARYCYHQALLEGRPEVSSVAYNDLGIIDRDQRLLGPAKEEFLLSLKYDPNNISALGNLAWIYLQQGDLNLAKPFFLRVLQLNKYSLEARLNLAYISEQGSDLNGAIGLLKQNLDIVPDESRSLAALVEIYTRLGDKANAQKYSQMLIERERS